MPSFSYIATRDDASINAGDRGWKGVDMLQHPALVAAGFASEAKNMRFRFGVAETRGGYSIPIWTTLSGTAWTTSALHGAGAFRDPVTHLDYGLLAVNGGVYLLRDGNMPAALPLPAGVTLSGSVTFTQCFDTVILFRGESLAPLAMTNTTAGFEAISQTPSGPGTEAIPNAERGLFFGNRLLIPHGDDEVAISDPNDYTRYVPVYSEAYINSGGSDKLVALAPYSESTFIAFKERSVHAIANCYGGDWGSVMQRIELTSEFGLAAPKAWARCGKDIWFLSELGVMSLTQTDTGKIQSAVLPDSAPIQPLIDRINWDAISTAAAAYHDSRFYLAVPLDSATVASTVLVYDFINAAWSGYDDLSGIAGVVDWIRLKSGGRRVLLALMSDGWVRRAEYGATDDTTFSVPAAIATSLTTRAMVNDYDDWHAQDVLTLALQYADPVYSVSLLAEGVNETTALDTNRTVTRTAYFTAGMAAYTLTNANNDFGVKRRQDYTIYPGDAALFGTGLGTLYPDKFQEVQRAITLGTQCRAPQVQLSTSSGRVRWLRCNIEGRNLTTRQGVLT